MNKINNLKTALLLVFVTNISILWSAAPSIFNNYTHYLSYDDDIFITGMKVDMSAIECRFSINSENNYNVGLSVFSDNYLKKFPMKFQYGNLSIGGLVSKLKTPSIDTSFTGFSQCYSEPVAITSSLPAYSYFTSPDSTFLELGYKNEDSLIENILVNGAYTPENKDLSFSYKVKLSFSDNCSISNSSGINFFNLEKYSGSFWYSDTPYYNEDRNICFVSQLGLKLFNFHSNFSLFCYETPFSEIRNIYKTENKFETRHFNFGFEAFINNSRYVIYKDNQNIKPSAQFMGNIQYKLNFGNNDDSCFRIGLTGYENITGKEDYNDLKIALSSSLGIPLTSILLEGKLSYKINKEDENAELNFASASIENKWNFKYFTTTLGSSSQYYISTLNNTVSKNYRINLDFDILKGIITNANSFSFKMAQGDISNRKINTGVNLNLSYKKVIVLIKISADFCL